MKIIILIIFSFKRLVKWKHRFKKDRKSSSKKTFKELVYYDIWVRTHFKLVELISGNMCCQPENIISLKLKLKSPKLLCVKFSMIYGSNCTEMASNYLDSDCLPDPPTPIRSIWLSGCFRTLEMRHKCSRAKLKSTKSIGFLLTALCLTRRSSATPLKWKMVILIWY